MSVQIVQPKKPIKCCTAGCEKEITTAELEQQDDGSIKVTMKCSDGHISSFTGLPDASSKKNGKLPVFVSYVKLVGVTFSNPDGTQRQSLLRYVKEGDEISIEHLKISDDAKKSYIVRHPIGILGVIRTNDLQPFVTRYPGRGVTGKIAKIFGGTNENPNIGCTIQLLPCATDNLKDFRARSANKKVFVDGEGQPSIYHTNPHCSGLQNAKPVSMEYAQTQLKARPCKKCAVD